MTYRAVFLAGLAGGTSGRAWAKAGARRSRVVHLVMTDAGDFARALCGSSPLGKSAGWASASGEPSEVATCPRCRSVASRGGMRYEREEAAERECAVSRQIAADILAEQSEAGLDPWSLTVKRIKEGR